MRSKKHIKATVSVNELHSYFKKLYSGMSRDNWRERIITYLDKVKVFSGGPADERMVSGWIGGLCEHAYYVAAHERSVSFRLDFDRQLKKIIASADLPKFLSRPGPVICGKRQPSFSASVVPTLERFQVMERLSEVFGDGVDAIIIGGSMSYIPFFGIRENKNDQDFSDVDTLIIINNNFFNKSSWKKFINCDLFPEDEKEKFISRIKIFQKLNRDNTADVFSQRFSIVGKSFTVSNHFITQSVFKRMVCTDLKKSLKSRRDMQYIMRDFRVNEFRHPCHARHTFDGQRFESIIDGYELKQGGFISNMPGYIIFNGKFYPGVYHTVISPAFLVFYDRTGSTIKLVKEFENILNKEVKYIRKKSPWATYAKAHNRYDIFPPGRYDDGRNSYLSKKEMKKYLNPSNLRVVELKSNFLLHIMSEDEKSDFGKRKRVYEKTLKVLEEWKFKTLRELEREIRDFMDKSNFETIKLLENKLGNNWYTVATVPCRKRLLINLPLRYRDGNSRNMTSNRNLLFTQKITPSDIMGLNAYEKLASFAGKVYIGSIMDPSSEGEKLPISYALIISVK